MNEEKHFKELPKSEDTVIKLSKGTRIDFYNILFDAISDHTYISTRQFIDQVVARIVSMASPKELFQDGFKLELLEPGKQWKKVNLRFRVVVEYTSDEPKEIQPPESPLDEIRR